MSSITPVQNLTFPFQPQPLSSVTFVVEDKEIQIETRFLKACDYFKTEKEDYSEKIKVSGVSLAAFKLFQTFLEEGEISCEYSQALEVFKIARQYQHKSLLEKMIARLLQEIPFHFSDVLSFA